MGGKHLEEPCSTRATRSQLPHRLGDSVSLQNRSNFKRRREKEMGRKAGAIQTVTSPKQCFMQRRIKVTLLYIVQHVWHFKDHDKITHRTLHWFFILLTRFFVFLFSNLCKQAIYSLALFIPSTKVPSDAGGWQVVFYFPRCLKTFPFGVGHSKRRVPPNWFPKLPHLPSTRPLQSKGDVGGYAKP